MAKQWWAFTVAMAMTLSTGAAIAGNKDASEPSTDRTTQSGTKPIEDDQTAGDRMNQAGEEVREKAEGAEMKISDLHSDQVKKIQQKLSDEGFYKARVDGIFGPKTTAALHEFASAKGVELKEGVLDSPILSQLDMRESEIEPVKGADEKKVDEEKKLEEESKTPEMEKQSGSVEPQSGTDSTLNNGSTGPASGGETSSNPTGVNAGTSPSQSGSSMGTDTGVSGATTPSSEIEKQRGSDVSVSSNTEVILQAQLALREKGILKGPTTGTLDKDTQNALKTFQKDNKLPVTGKLDEKTLAKLGVNTAAATPVDKVIDKSGTTTTPDTVTTPGTISTPATP